jgi:hypothetical protein
LRSAGIEPWSQRNHPERKVIKNVIIPKLVFRFVEISKTSLVLHSETHNQPRQRSDREWIFEQLGMKF